MNYEMKELLPIVAELTEKYTSGESTSVSYEKARQLMEAVLYCMEQGNAGNQLISGEKVPAEIVYRRGYEKLICRVKETQAFYNELIMDFCAYGNKNYNDTVTGAIPGFFRYYDVRFAPQETVITMDYPTICPTGARRGIDAVQTYVEYISLEQKFMNLLPRDYVYGILYRFQPDYQKQFYNICSIVLRHILACMMIGKALGKAGTVEDYEMLKSLILENGRSHTEERLSECLEKLIAEKYHGEKALETYLRSDLENFAVELCTAAEYDRLERVVVL